MSSSRFVSGVLVVAAVVAASHRFVSAGPRPPSFTVVKQWTHGHTTPGQASEIPAYDAKTNTIWVAGIVGVDVLDAATGELVQHLDVTPHGAVNSVAIHKGLAALAVEAASFDALTCPSCDRRNPGKVLFYNTKTRALASGINEVAVGSLPDMLTFTPDGDTLLVANEGTPNVAADAPYLAVDPPGSVSIIDVATRAVVGTALLDGVATSGENLRLPASTGMDFEPEYISVSKDNLTAYVTIQEANAVAVLDLTTRVFTRIIGLGAKDFSLPGNEIDPKDNDGVVSFQSVAAKGLYMPDGIATYKRKGETYLVMANEGDYREDDGDRSAAGTFGAIAPLDRLRVSNRDSSAGNLFAAGARSFSIRRTDGTLVFDSGSLLDRLAHAFGVYDNGRSRDKGVEPEGVSLLKIKNATFAFIGLERALSSAVAIFEITNPTRVRFVDFIVTPGDLAPEGLTSFRRAGKSYLVVSNETVAPGAMTSNTSLYLLDTEAAEAPESDDKDDKDDKD